MPDQRFQTAALRYLWAGYRCRRGSWSSPDFYGMPIGGCPTPAVDAYKALERALKSEGYQANDVWSYVCRNIVSSGLPSLHGYGTAIDIDWNQNPQTIGGDPFSGELKKNHVDAVMKIKVANGNSLWWWGGYWTSPTQVDRMHFQLDCTPSEATTINWATVPGGGSTTPPKEDDDLAYMNQEAQEYFQEMYNSLKKDPDKPSGEKNPPGPKLFSYLASFHRWAVKKSATEGTDYDTIVAKFLKDSK